MAAPVVWRIAAPMIGLGAVMLALGTAAAWNVHQQQQTSSELIEREVRGMVTIDELHMAVREIRYQLNLLLRTRDAAALPEISELSQQASRLLKECQALAHRGEESERIEVVAIGFEKFLRDYREVAEDLKEADYPDDADQVLATLPESIAARIAQLGDELLTNEVLQPLGKCMATNQQVVERTTAASKSTAQHLKMGFLLSGICGGATGLLLGIAISRTVGQSIVRLDVTIRGVAGRLSDVTGPISFSHTGDLDDIEAGLKSMEANIADVMQRLQQREKEVLRSEQLARVGQVAAGLAHELRNPLMPMKMLVQAALEKDPQVGLKGRSLLVLNDEIARLESAIQKFLDFSRPPTLSKAQVEMGSLLVGVLDLVKARAQMQGVQLSLIGNEKLYSAEIDGVQIRQLVLNLVLNSLDVLPEGGQIDVRIAAVDRPPGAPNYGSSGDLNSNQLTEHDALRMIAERRRTPAQAENPWLVISVSDNGPGIPLGQLEEVFEPFVTTKETGLGLGLSNCRRIAAAHGGSLVAHHRQPCGACFELMIPCSAPID